MLHVMAKDKATNKEQSIRITSSSGLSKEEVEKMKRDAEAHATEDKKKKEEIDLRNQADNLVFQTRKQMTDLGDKIDANTKSKLESATNALDEAVKSGNASDIKSKTDELNKVWNDASTKMYEAAKTSGAQQEQAHAHSASDNGAKKDGKAVENAEFEVVDEKK
jgi:molecular chaperone DnaK